MPEQRRCGRAGPAPADRPALTVLNNSRYSGLASRTAARFRARGWTVAKVGNLRGRVPYTTVYYPAGAQQQALDVAVALKVPRVLPRPAWLPGTGMTVVLTRDAA